MGFWDTTAGLYLLINVVSFAMMGIDKFKARTGRWRISEAALFTAALCFGAVGGCAGMWTFHHKTRHWYFRLGFPLLAAVQLVIISFLTGRYLGA